MTILITGSRGGIGAGLLHRLSASGHDVRAASRAPEQADPPPGVTAVALDLADATTFAPALAGVTDVFLYAEPTRIERLLDAAVSAGVRRMVLLSSDSVNLPNAEHNALARHHLLVERALRAAPLTSTVLRPGGFATMTLGWAESIRADRPIEQAYPEARLDVIHPQDIIDVAESSLTTHALDGETISLGGPEVLSFRDQARILGDLLNREIELRAPAPEQAAAHLSAHVPAPFVAAVLDYWAQLSDRRIEASRTAERITGRPGRTFRQWVTENLASFR
ncbi:NAD(P)H-binding protein [Streptomyces violaceusniger]|uniref:Saccharopine dehydrogenase n=1 Tax=Streptomyces violaceusniger (strain Tu 4113) TaxID=653045 RepID=G2P165_STRV4|nr:NAD(P)H-binding protein [Streptomyces violaceusniger]AEM87904.1 Saccharopine dehydrogenase [Streptomyces violaceusniger Tu 4113]